MKALFLVSLLLAAFVAAAELTYPVDHTAQWQIIDTTDCSTVGGPRSWPALDPDTYDCDTEPCGVDPDYPPYYAALRVVNAGVFPDYDGNLSRVESPYFQCGPDTGTCYDARCSNTDVLQQIHEVVDLTEAQRLQALNNRAARALLESVSENERDLMIWLSASMLMQLVDGATLPNDWQGVNFQALYTNYKQKYQDTAAPVVVRRTELRERILDDSIQNGEIDTGWPVPVE